VFCDGVEFDMRSILCVVVAAVGIFAASTVAQDRAQVAQRGGTLPQLFPADNWWNQDITGAPLDARSAAVISFIGTSRQLHPDFGGCEDPPTCNSIYGIPFVTVGADQPKRAVQFEYADESDGAGVPFYPIPDEAITQRGWIEGGPPGNQDPGGDRHMLIVDRDNQHLYELFALRWNGAGWEAGSGAFFDLRTNNRRPETWTSADAAGLAILPGLVRYDEVFGPNEINHAFRFTLSSSNGYVWPASHRAGSNPSAPPFGMRMRLKASKDISGYPAEIQKIFRAMKRYGLIFADNGSNMYITGAHDTRWNNGILNPAFHSLTANDFEVVEFGWRGNCTAAVAPSALSHQVSGQTVQLNWTAASDTTEMVLEAGSASGQANLVVLPLAGSARSFTTTGVPFGTYFVRTRARNACGTSPPSNEVVVVVGCTAPNAPTGFAANVNGNTVTLNWNGPGATSYVIEVGSAPGLSNVVVAALPPPPVVAIAPPATYFARLRGQNACGTGPPSSEIVVTVR
jgi:hypothetical protein